MAMLRLLVALVLTIALGLLSRVRPIGLHMYDKSLGDSLYAIAAYLALALILPRRRPLVLASLALAGALPSKRSRRRVSRHATSSSRLCGGSSAPSSRGMM
jgi:hypothetical protein